MKQLIFFGTLAALTLASFGELTSVHAQSGTIGSGSVPSGGTIIQRQQIGSGTAGSSAGTATTGSASAGSMTQGSATGSSSKMGSNAKGRMASATLGLAGYCPVCILDMKKWVKGNPKYSVLLDGKIYHFPGEEQKQQFLKYTTKYTPALNGDCVVCFADGGVRSPGSVHYSAIHQGRLFLFPGQAEKDKFMAAPRKYENVDLAQGGMCSVCRVEMNQQVPGQAAYGTVYKGKRYYFKDMQTKKMFLAQPTKYAQ